MKIVQVLVYSASWCRDCREAKRFLESHNIPYTEVDIEETPGAAEEDDVRRAARVCPALAIQIQD